MITLKNSSLQLWLMSFFVLLSATATAQSPDTLTLEYCHRRAVGVYPLVKQRQLNSEASSIQNENSGKNYLPQFGINGRASYQSDVTKIDVNVPGVIIPFPDKDMYDLYLGLDQLIWDGGITREQKKLEEAGLKINQQQIEVELYKLKERINGLYFKILLLRKNKEQLLTNKQVVQEKMEELESGIRNGVVLQSAADVLMAQILEIDQGVTEADNDLAATFGMLSELMDMVLNENVVLKLPDPPIEAETYINLRPEYLLLNLQKDKLESSKNMITATYMPKFSGFGKLGLGKPGLNMMSSTFQTYYFIGVGFKWNIINWERQKNQKKILEVQQGIVEVQKETFDKNIKTQALDDLAQVNKYNELMKSDQEIIDLRNKIAKTASSQFDNGMITSTQYLDELNKATRAMLNLEVHRIQLSMSKINYLKAIGKL
jgi:outer membrane protein TolC